MRRLSAALLAGAVLGVAAPPAAAAPVAPFPGSTRSHYLTTTSRQVVSRAAARDARDAAAAGIADALVVLAAGDPAGGDVVTLPGSGRRSDVDDVGDAVVAYGRTWRATRHAPPLTLVVMQAGHGPHVGVGAGRAFGRMVSGVATSLPGVDVRGGLDVEVEWAAASAVRSWLGGYLGATARPFVDVGSCTCPPYAAVSGRWTLADLVAVAWAGGRGRVLPQVYATAGGSAREWAALAAWARRHGRPPVRLAGVLTEQAACTGPPRRPCAGIDLDPRSAWRQLSRASGQRLRWATDIGYLPDHAPLHGPSALRTTAYAAGAFLVAAAVSTLTVAAVRHRRGAPGTRAPIRRRARRTRRRVRRRGRR